MNNNVWNHLLFLLLLDVTISNTTYYMDYNDVLTMSSPNYPDNYFNDQDIFWHVHGLVGHAMVIRFGTVLMESCCDYVRLYTGRTASFQESAQIFHLTGMNNSTTSLLPDEYWSAYSNMWLHFHTDRSVFYQGFQAWVTLASLDGQYRMWLT